MSSVLCRGGLPRPPVVTDLISVDQFARVVGASRLCRSRRYTLAPLLSVATLSSPGPRAQHPTSHRVVRPVTDDCTFDGCQILCVGVDRRVRPHRKTTRIRSIEQRNCLSCFRWPVVGVGHCACPFGVSVIVARGQAWKPAPTGLGSKSGMPVQRQILLGADRCVRPHRETTRIQSIKQRKCLSCFRWPLVGAGLCACPVGVLVIGVRGQAWKPAPTEA